MQGLYKNPPEPCIQCQNFANDMALINAGYVGLDAARDTWLNFNALLKQNAFVIFGKLLTITIIFTNFFTVVDRMYKNQFLMSVPQLLLDVLSDEEMQETVKDNILNGIEQKVFLLGSMPGASCKSIGFRIGTLFRQVFGVSYENV